MNQQLSVLHLFQVLSLVRSHSNGECARVYALLLPNQIYAPGCAAQTPPRHGLRDSLLLRQFALTLQVSIPYCFNSVPYSTSQYALPQPGPTVRSVPRTALTETLLYRSVSPTASTMCPYSTDLLHRQCDLPVQVYMFY